MRALVRRHHVTWRTAKAALTNPEPPAREPLPRRPSAIDSVQHLIDLMIDNGHSPTETWTRLMDEHDTSISYGAVRLHVHNRTTR
ncbi:hypothetical protein ACIBLB_20045 [Streptosporangium canum]|uniref:hypothetical protein n=1 Tax=Streptosporangium canum TaxID=324952 RepID=UPI0037B5D113